MLKINDPIVGSHRFGGARVTTEGSGLGGCFPTIEL